jgi:twitching motility protein PilT
MAEGKSAAAARDVGALAVQHGMLTELELQAVRQRGAALPGNPPIHEVLVREHYLTAELAEQLLKAARGEAAPTAAAHPTAESSPGAQRAFVDYLDHLCERDADEVRLVPGQAPALTFGDRIEAFAEPPLAPPVLERLMTEVVPPDQRDMLGRGLMFSRTAERHGRRFRVHVTPTIRGASIVARALGEDPSKREVVLPGSVIRLAELPRGLVVVAGSRETSRSRALAYLVDLLNQHRAAHVLTIERLLDYEHECRKSLVAQREVGVHTDSYAAALAGAVREDPDVIVVGEISDAEAIAMAVQAAETGHLVLCSLHAADEVQALRRLVDVQGSARRDLVRTALASALQAVAVVDEVTDLEGRQNLVADVLPRSEAVVRFIREDRLHQLDSLKSAAMGLLTRDDALVKLYAGERITRLVALERMRDPARLDNARHG